MLFMEWKLFPPLKLDVFQKSWDLENSSKYCQFFFHVWNYIYFMILDIKKTFLLSRKTKTHIYSFPFSA